MPTAKKSPRANRARAATRNRKPAEAYVKKYGADVVRLWVASQDYRNDIVVSEERINKVSETYRGIRNTLRYQLSNLYDFDPAKHAVPDDKLTGLDRWILSEFSKLEPEVIEAYDKYEFHVVYQKLSQFIAVELSSIYHDVVKDRLYTDAANSPRRRSTQTALLRLVTGLCQMLSPILVFTADEAWEFVPAKPTASVHLASWKPAAFNCPMRSAPPGKLCSHCAKWRCRNWKKRARQKPSAKRWTRNCAFRKKSRAVRQRKRTSGIIARIAERLAILEINPGRRPEHSVSVTKADGQKCERCWHWETDVGSNPEHPTICARCVAAVRKNLS